MSSGKHLSIHPPEVQFPFELNKQISCIIQVCNNTDNYVAFKVKATDETTYSVWPNYGIVLPNSTCYCLVEMQAQKNAPADMQCKDKFLIQSLITSPNFTISNPTSDMFEMESEILVDEYEMRVTFVSPPQPAPITVLEASLYNLSLNAATATLRTPDQTEDDLTQVTFHPPTLYDNNNGGSSSNDVQGGMTNVHPNSTGTSGLDGITCSEWQQMLDLMNIPKPKDRIHGLEDEDVDWCEDEEGDLSG